MASQIIFGFSTHKNFNLISWAIRSVEKTPYSHVYIRFKADSLGRWLIYQASHDQLNFMPMDDFKSINSVVEEYAVAVSDVQKRDVVRYCVDTVSRPYGRLNLIGVGVSRLAKDWFGLDLKNPFRDGGKTQICAELAGRILNILGAGISDQDLELAGPKYINSIVSAFPQTTKL